MQIGHIKRGLDCDFESLCQYRTSDYNGIPWQRIAGEAKNHLQLPKADSVNNVFGNTFCLVIPMQLI